MKNKSKWLIILLVLVVGGVGIYLYVNSDEDSDSDKSNKTSKLYKAVENNLIDAGERYVKDYEDDIASNETIIAKQLIKKGYLDEDDLEVPKEKDTCDGYISINLGNKKKKTEIKAYIKCQNYETKDYDEKVTMVSAVKSLSYQLLNEDKLDETLSIENIELDREDVIIKGSQNNIDEVASVKALIDFKKIKIEEAGKLSVKDINLVAYDSDGKAMDNILVVPSKISVEIYVTSYYKSVPIKVETTGELITGKAIDSIELDTDEVIVYGKEEIVDDIKYVPVTVDINNLGKDDFKKYKVTLSKPSGVNKLSEKEVTVTITFADEEQKEVGIKKISVINLTDGLQVNIKNKEDLDNIKVIVKGSANSLKSFDEESINAYVDLKGLDRGNHKVEVKIVSNDPKFKYIVSKKIDIVID